MSNESKREIGSGQEGPSAASLLDSLRQGDILEASERDAIFDRLIAGFSPDDLLDAVRPRLADLSGGDAEAVLRVVEAFGARADMERLAFAVAAQPDLSPERAWEALAILEGSGLIESDPELADRWDELASLIEEGTTSEELAEQIEAEPADIWVALQGLDPVEPEVRAAIITGLSGSAGGPGLARFLRYLVYAHDEQTRRAAFEAIQTHATGAPWWVEALSVIAASHPDTQVAAEARRRLPSGEPVWGLPAEEVSPRLLRAEVTAIDGQGRGRVLLAAEDPEGLSIAAFEIDVNEGILAVAGQTFDDSAMLDEAFMAFGAAPERDRIDHAPELARRLVAGSLLLCGPSAPVSLAYWIERTLGCNLRPLPFATIEDEEHDPTSDFEQAHRRACAILDACPGWRDTSTLTYELADEAVHHDGPAVDDPGAIRFMFERGLSDRLESWRRRLLWMSAFWRTARVDDLARSARLFAVELSDPQHVVPGHAFIAELSRRSIHAAVEDLRRGYDPRRSDRQATG